jgi:hypothetical protein
MVFKSIDNFKDKPKSSGFMNFFGFGQKNVDRKYSYLLFALNNYGTK